MTQGADYVATHARLAASPEQRLLNRLVQLQRSALRRAPLADLLDGVAAALRDVFPEDMVAVRLLDPVTPDALILAAHRGLHPDQVRLLGKASLADAGLCGQAVLRGGLVVAEDYRVDGATVGELVATGLRTAMSAPLADDSAVPGAVLVASGDPYRVYSERQRALLANFAAEIGPAVVSGARSRGVAAPLRDPITGLASQALYEDRLGHALACAEREATPTAMLLIGLDPADPMDGVVGRTAGEQLLVAVAERLRGAVRATDTAARLYGSQFAVLLHNVHHPEQAVLVGRRILERLRAPYPMGERLVQLAPSIGIAFSDVGARDPRESIYRAGLAQEAARRGGGCRYELFSPAMQVATGAPVDLRVDLRHAVARGQLSLRYQPIVELATARITGFEALVRWEHPTHGTIPPLEFIPLAEETGLIDQLGRWVMEHACGQVARWNAERAGESPLSVSVNVSVCQLRQPDLPRTVREILATVGLPASCLTLEITESMLLPDDDSTIARLHQLKAIGVQLAIDDFGIGYSSLSHLRRFPIDMVKIDKMFVDELTSDIGGATLTRAIVGLGRSMRVATVAEGIEAAEQCQPLRDSGCELGQGFYFAKPLTGDEANALLAAQPDQRR